MKTQTHGEKKGASQAMLGRTHTHWDLESTSQCLRFLILEVRTGAHETFPAYALAEHLRILVPARSGPRQDKAESKPSGQDGSPSFSWVTPACLPVRLEPLSRSEAVRLSSDASSPVETAVTALFSHPDKDLWLKWTCAGAAELVTGLQALQGTLARLPDIALIALLPGLATNPPGDREESGASAPDERMALVLSEGLLGHPLLRPRECDTSPDASPGSSPAARAMAPQEPPLPFSKLLGDLQDTLRGFALPPLGVLMPAMSKLARVISHLRAPGGCPWDRAQDFSSLRPFLIEEAYEASAAAAALVTAPSENLPEAALAFADELGDVLLQIVLNAQLASEAGLFNLLTVLESLSEKMIRRHPHVFAHEADTPTAANPDEVKELWEGVKAQERKESDPRGTGPSRSSLLKKALKKSSLPTLDFATAVSKRATKFGFCWTELSDVWGDVESEIRELRDEVLCEKPDFDRLEDEIGDVCFALANVLVHCKANLSAPESLSLDDALRKSIQKFATRFAEMESIYAEEQGMPLDEETARSLSLEAWNTLWHKAKKRRYR